MLADGHGHVVALGERECSVQRRHQKVIEESPSLRASRRSCAREMEAAAVAVAKACGYRSAGTVEFLVGADRRFYFLEMNTRLQVEHPITEMRYGVDLVARAAARRRGPAALLRRDGARAPRATRSRRASARRTPTTGFLPSTGRLGAIQLPGGPGRAARRPRGRGPGDHAPLRQPAAEARRPRAPTARAAIARLRRALHETRLPGVTTNLPLLAAHARRPALRRGRLRHVDPRRERARTDAVPDDLVPVVAAALALHRRAPGRVPPAARRGAAVSPWVLEPRAASGSERR